MGARGGFVYKTEDDLISTSIDRCAARSETPTPCRIRSSTSVWTAARHRGRSEPEFFGFPNGERGAVPGDDQIVSNVALVLAL